MASNRSLSISSVAGSQTRWYNAEAEPWYHHALPISTAWISPGEIRPVPSARKSPGEAVSRIPRHPKHPVGTQSTGLVSGMGHDVRVGHHDDDRIREYCMIDVTDTDLRIGRDQVVGSSGFTRHTAVITTMSELARVRIIVGTLEVVCCSSRSEPVARNPDAFRRPCRRQYQKDYLLHGSL